jgi:hypothetical protein
MIRHSASTVNRSSPPLEILKMANVQGGDCFCLRYLLSDGIMTNNAYAKNNGDGLLCSILCHWAILNVNFCKSVYDEKIFEILNKPDIF